MEFLEKIKQELRPDSSVIREVNDFVQELNSELERHKIKAVCVAGGSVAKSTFLKGDFDVDIFVRFDYSYKDRDISKILEPVLKKYKYELLHGSRDYFQIKDNLNYEIVPVLDIKDPKLAMNVTDMSPMHVDWVKKHLKEGREDDIRLTKKFCKVAGVYGAESYIRGFSGHVIDIMIIYYGSFLNLLKAAVKWKAPVIIDPVGYYKSNRDVVLSMNQSKIEGPLIVVDPLLQTRNAASAISYEKFSLFKKRAASFLKNPSEKFFSEVKITKDSLNRKYKNITILTLKAVTGKKDVVGSRIVKSFSFMKSELKKVGYDIKSSGWYWGRHVLFWFSVKNKILPKTRIIQGPPINIEEHANSFREKYKKCFEKNRKLYAEVVIEKRKIEENITNIAADSAFRLKVVKIE